MYIVVRSILLVVITQTQHTVLQFGGPCNVFKRVRPMCSCYTHISQRYENNNYTWPPNLPLLCSLSLWTVFIESVTIYWELILLFYAGDQLYMHPHKKVIWGSIQKCPRIYIPTFCFWFWRYFTRGHMFLVDVKRYWNTSKLYEQLCI